jgi:predicted RND superfamily exporter protein
MKVSLLILIFINIPFLIWGLGTPQKNPEELFLSDDYLHQLTVNESLFENEELIFISHLKPEEKMKLISFFESKELSFSDLSLFKDNLGLFEIPKKSDEENIQFFGEIKSLFPDVLMAGDSFTNMHLALMAKKIQDFLFPFIFGLIFLGLFFLTKNIVETLYLFFSSLLGASLGLSFVKFLYGHSTILTTLTPLIGFVLTLGLQFHIVYGFKVFKNKDLFFKHKLRPLILMMGTTVIGFVSLMSSELESIRQLSLSTSLTLISTWGIGFLLLMLFPPVSNNPTLNITPRMIPHIKISPWAGYFFLSTLLMGGVFALKKMPILVDAVHFFSKDHEVQMGFSDISKKLQGTPQFEIIIQRKDSGPLEFSDLQKVDQAETSFSIKLGRDSFLSLNQLVKKINFLYSHSSSLPDNSFAYEALLSKIPSVLIKNLRSDQALKFIYIGDPFPSEKREEIVKNVTLEFEKLLPDYKISSSGLRHFLLLSQKNLVLTLVKSFALSFFFISIIFAFFNRNLKEVVDFCLINAASIFGGLFFIWTVGMTLNISTVMTVSISMGLVVDSTIHLMYASNLGEDFTSKFQSTTKPIILSHLVLLGAFTILSFESFLPIGDFSRGLLILLLLGLILDLFILPILSKK